MEERRIPQLPGLPEVQETIERFLREERSMDWKESMAPDQFLRHMESNLPFLSRGLLRLLRPVPEAGMRFYRLRITEQPIQEELLSEYGPPPAQNYVRYDRCSIPRHPVMYCAANPSTAFQETMFLDKVHSLRKNQYGYLSEWRIKPGCELRVTPFLFGALPLDSELRQLVDPIEEAMRKLLCSEYSQEQAESAIEVMRYLSDLFRKDNTRSISSFIAHGHLYMEHHNRPEVFMYPSVQAKLCRANFAIHPNALDKMELVRTWNLALMEIDPFKRSFVIRWHSKRNNEGGYLKRTLIGSEEGATWHKWYKEDLAGLQHATENGQKG